MHELSIVYELYRTVTQLAAEAGLHRVEAVRLQVGELSGVEGPYLRECWNAVVRDTPLRSTRLELEHLPAIAMCAHCARCMLIWPVPALAPVAVATIISFCPAANSSSTGSRGIKNQPTTVRLFAQSSAFICFFELTVGGVQPDHALTAGEKMTLTGVPERQYFAANL